MIQFKKRRSKCKNFINKFIWIGEKSTDSLERSKMYLIPDYLLDGYFFDEFLNKFLILLLCRINVLDIKL